MTPLTTYLVETFLILLAVIGIAILVLFGAKRLGVGRPHGPMQLIGRMPLDARRALYLVQVADQVLILGASEAGLTKLGELRSQDLPSEPQSPKPSFKDILTSFRNKSPIQSTQPKENPNNGSSLSDKVLG